MRMQIRINQIGIFLFTLFLTAIVVAQDGIPLERIIEYKGAKRKYYVRLPKNFDAKNTYWLLVAVHGGSGQPKTNGKIVAIHQFANKMELPSIVVSPEFNTKDKQVSRFPALGEGAFLKEVLKEIRTEYKVHPKILITGYSMGGQFTHRFTLANPGLVQACAPFSAGTWSTPDGKLLIEGYGEVEKPKDFLLSKENAKKVPKRLRNLFDGRTADVAGHSAKNGAEKVPFLVMCGSLDTRFDITQKFVAALQKAGVTVETEYPETTHRTSSYEYPKHAIAFFKKHIGSKK